MLEERQQMEKTYQPKTVEDKWYQYWEENDCFPPHMDGEKPAFTIVMPPPNVTGKLHMGHAMDNTMQDILVRYKRLRGFNTLWVPGTDHAGIATQAKVETQLREEGLNKIDLGREAFIERCWAWKETYGSAITEQIRKLGASCDWNRERFTMDEGCSRAVREAFVSLYERDLIYQGNYIINWCPHCHTTISDIEVEHAENTGKLYYVNYYLEDDSGYLTVATTRPETMFGDTAVAVHPDDERYKQFIGKNVILPIIEKPIPVIADAYVDPEFGTGAVKITPAHDVNDFEMGQRHHLPQVVVMDDSGTMNEHAGPYAGMDRFACREKVVEDLADTPHLDRVEDYMNAVGHCYRCDTVIEPMVSKQWFVRMDPLAKPALDAVYQKDIRFIPDRFTKIYTGWMENIRDWCISRQLWWGHRIPVWYCQDCHEVMCRREAPTHCTACDSTNLVQDEDVLDTWFSSGLWPFEVLGWPEDTEDLALFYPTSVLVTGRDIIFFWVARMIVDGYAFTNQHPFSDVLIHGLVLDEQGRKMSKSLGNGIDPLEEIDVYGADALRLTLVTGIAAGNDLRFRREKMEASRNFTNKLWNAARFVQMNTEDFEMGSEAPAQSDLADRWIVSRLQTIMREMSEQLDRYELGEASRMIHDFIWNEFCDWYIELIKPRLYGRLGDVSRKDAQKTAVFVLKNACVLLHPFMPFITEEIWQHFSINEKSIMVTQWPVEVLERNDVSAEEDMNAIMDTIRSIRGVRRDLNISPGKKINMMIRPKDAHAHRLFEDRESDLLTLGGLEKIDIIDEAPANIDQMISNVIHGNEMFIPLFGVIDFEEESKRISKEIGRLDQEILRAEKKLSNQGFIAKAPVDVVQNEHQKLAAYQADREVAIQQMRRLDTLHTQNVDG